MERQTAHSCAAKTERESKRRDETKVQKGVLSLLLLLFILYPPPLFVSIATLFSLLFHQLPTTTTSIRPFYSPSSPNNSNPNTRKHTQHHHPWIQCPRSHRSCALCRQRIALNTVSAPPPQGNNNNNYNNLLPLVFFFLLLVHSFIKDTSVRDKCKRTLTRVCMNLELDDPMKMFKILEALQKGTVLPLGASHG